MSVLELLAPAGNKALGMAAVEHGADAVYIGAARYGARSAAGNSIKDIQDLCDYAHFYRAKVYVALNTLLFDDELSDARKLIFQIWDAGADALIIQDMGLLELDLPPIPLFASTQTDNRTPEKVKFLEASGFQRVILARELSLSAIATIRTATRVDLEAFVHGALCVCYSGQCYMSAAIGGRSANRGACGQPCRLPWNLVSGQGKVLARNRYLLSLKDMDRSDHLSDLAEAGITSFKIEGRLKDLAYVKNITALYRRRLDALIQGHKDYDKASSGRTVFTFAPDPAKTFSRGGTDYYLTGTGPEEVHAMDTPKSRGEAAGHVDRTGPDWVALTGGPKILNGDGLCFVDSEGRFQGFRVNRVDKEGRLYPPGRDAMKKIPLKKGMPMFRNHDHAFSRQMAGETARRELGLCLVLSETPDGITLEGRDEDGFSAVVGLTVEKEAAKNPDQALSSIKKQLGKLGNTPFYLTDLTVSARPLFFQARVLNQLRRDLVQALVENREISYERKEVLGQPGQVSYPGSELDFRGNVANQAAERFYKKRGVLTISPAFEKEPSGPGAPVMTTRHCIRHSLGQCTRENKKRSSDWDGPLYLENGRAKFKVIFDCSVCEMTILS